MTAVQTARGRTVNRMLHVNQSAGDLLNKLEAVRLLCQETGCAQRYLAHDALNAIGQVSARIDDARGSTEHRARFADYLAHVQDEDLSLGIAMTDAKGDRSRRPHEQANPDTYVHIVERSAKGIVISGTKAIVTGAPYMHEFLVMPCRHMSRGRRGLRGLLRGAGRRAGHDHRRAPGRAARREGRARCAAVLAPLRPVDRRRHLRQGLRALGARVLRRRVGALRRADLRTTPPTTATAASARAPASATC